MKPKPAPITLISVVGGLLLVLGGFAYHLLVWLPKSKAYNCATNMSSIDKAALSYYGMNNQEVPKDIAELVDNGYCSPVTCPSGGTYTLTYLGPPHYFKVTCSHHGTHKP